MYSLSDFDFDLPDALIAQTPLPQRSASRLLQVDGDSLHDKTFADVVALLSEGDLLVFNDTRVLKARFFGVKESGGKVEVLVERVLANTQNQHASRTNGHHILAAGFSVSHRINRLLRNAVPLAMHVMLR